MKQEAALALVTYLAKVDRHIGGGPAKVLAVTNRKHGGWGLPGGKCEEGEHPIHACVRELREETGLVVHPADLRKIGTSLWRDREVTIFHVTHVALAPLGQQEDGTVPRWRVYEEMIAESPFGEFYRELLPNGIEGLGLTWIEDGL